MFATMHNIRLVLRFWAFQSVIMNRSRFTGNISNYEIVPVYCVNDRLIIMDE